MDKRGFHECEQAFVGGLYLFHEEIPTNNTSRSMDGGVLGHNEKKKNEV